MFVFKKREILSNSDWIDFGYKNNFNILRIATMQKKLNLKNYIVDQEDKENGWIYFHSYYLGLLKTNIKGLYVYSFGWNYGIDGVTIVIRNKDILRFGEVIEKRREKTERDFYNKKNLIINKWEKHSYEGYWVFQTNKYGKLSNIRISFYDEYMNEKIMLFEGIFELLGYIKNINKTSLNNKEVA